MGRVLSSIYPDWAGGVVTAPEGDSLPVNATPRARNSCLASAGPGMVVIGRRKGATALNATPVTGSPAMLGIVQWKYRSSNTFTSYTLLVSDGGRLDQLNSDGTLTTVSATAFTSGTKYPAFCSVGNRLVIVNGTDKKKIVYKGSALTLQTLGMARPTAPTLADSGTAGNHNGTYVGYVTYINGTTGEESSASDASGSLTVASKQITWTIPVSADTQVTARKLYIQNTTSQTSKYLVTTVSDNSTTSYTSNVADASLVTLGPDSAENDPPVAGVLAAAEHAGRLFLASASTLYYSKVGVYEAFDPDNYEPQVTDDGQPITGLLAHDGVLYVFKRASIYAIVGEDPDSWQIIKVSAGVGAVAGRSIVVADGAVHFWALDGPYVLKALAQPQPLGTPILTTLRDDLNVAQFASICGVTDKTNARVQWALPGVDQSRNTLMLPFSTRLGVWESDRWDPFDVSCFGVVEDPSTGVPQVYVGTYSGEVMKWWDDYYDGVASSLTSSVTSAGSTTLTDSTQTFPTSGNGLKDRYVYAMDAAGTSQRRLISSNTATALTVSAAWNATPNTTYTYVVGAPDFAVDSRWDDGNMPFHKKRYEFVLYQLSSPTGMTSGVLDIFLNSALETPVRSQALTLASTGGVWDTSVWDTAAWGGVTITPGRVRVGKTGRSVRLRISLRTPGQALWVFKVGMQAELMTVKA